MVRISIYFTIAESNIEAVRHHFANVFLPAIRKQPGFMECLLLAPSDPSEHTRRLDITFATEGERRAWVSTPLHDRVYEPMVAQAADVHVERYVLAQ